MLGPVGELGGQHPGLWRSRLRPRGSVSRQHPPRGSAPTSGLGAHWACCHPFLPGFFFPGLDANLHRSWLSTCQLVQFWPCLPKGRCLSVCLAAGAQRCSWWQKLQLGVRRARRCLSLLLVPVPLARLYVGALHPEDEPRSPQSPK